MSKANELRGKPLEELRGELLALRREHFNLRVQQATGQTASTHRIREIRRQVARIKTVINESRKAGEAK